MKYTKEYKKRVLDAFDNDPYIESLLETDSEELGTILKQTDINISAEEVIDAFNNRKLPSLYFRATKLQAIRYLAMEWDHNREIENSNASERLLK